MQVRKEGKKGNLLKLFVHIIIMQKENWGRQDEGGGGK